MRLSFLELRVPPVAVTIIFGVSMWITATNIPAFAFDLPGRTVLSLIFVLIGTAAGISGMVEFHRARTTINPLKPTEASTMVTSGIYRMSRNPMYLGLLLLLAGWALVLANLAGFAFLPAFVAYMTQFQIRPEERALHAKFGSEFIAYKELARRWL